LVYSLATCTHIEVMLDEFFLIIDLQLNLHSPFSSIVRRRLRLDPLVKPRKSC
jgi:hypothetical protein